VTGLLALLLVATFLAASPVAGAGGTSEAIPLDMTEDALVPRVEWPILISAKSGGTTAVCDRLGPDDIEVKENGVKARVTNLDREHRPTIHALLLDTSGSMWMGMRLEQVKQAAEEYVKLIDSSDDQVMVVTFDVDLILRVPLTHLATDEARERVIDGIRRIPGDGGSTDISGSLYQLSVYLRELAERTVVILLTDGMTAGSSRAIRLGLHYDPEAVNNVTVFPIGIGLGRPEEEEYLETLAREAGGFSYSLGSATAVAEAFSDIQHRLRRQAFITYEPPDRLMSRKHRTSKTAGQAVRKVRIVATHPRCVVAAYKRKRLIADDSHALTRSGPDSEVLALTSIPGRGEGDFVIPAVQDITVEPGWSQGATAAAGLTFPSTFDIEQRDIEVHVPPVAADGSYSEVGPADMLAHWLKAGIDPVRGDDPDDPYFRTLNGQSLLELRMLLAAEILEFSEPHRTFAQAKMAAAIRKKLDREIHAEVGEATYSQLSRALEAEERFPEWATGVDRLQIEVLLRMFRGRMPLPDRETVQQAWTDERERLIDLFFEIRRDDPTPEDYQVLRGSVAAWLGDTSARDVAFELERRALNAVLGYVETDSAIETVPADVLSDRWDLFRGWFPAPRLQRIVTPLWLAYDPERDVFGFHRIFCGRIPELPPRGPYGLRAIDLLIAETERSRWRAVSVSHDDTPLGTLPRKLRAGLKKRADSVQHVTVELARIDDGRPAKIDVLYVELRDGSAEVRCAFPGNTFDAGLSPCQR